MHASSTDVGQLNQVDTEARSLVRPVLESVRDSRRFLKSINRHLDPFELTMDTWCVLDLLMEGPATQSAIVTWLGVSKVSISRWISRLGNEKYVFCTVDPYDHRVMRVHITAEGVQALRLATGRITRAFAR